MLIFFRFLLVWEIEYYWNMAQYQRRYKAARALQMIAESDCKVSDDSVFDNDDDDDYIASPDVDSEIEDHVSDTIRKNQTTTMHTVHP